MPDIENQEWQVKSTFDGMPTLAILPALACFILANHHQKKVAPSSHFHHPACSLKFCTKQLLN